MLGRRWLFIFILSFTWHGGGCREEEGPEDEGPQKIHFAGSVVSRADMHCDSQRSRKLQIVVSQKLNLVRI